MSLCPEQGLSHKLKVSERLDVNLLCPSASVAALVYVLSSVINNFLFSFLAHNVTVKDTPAPSRTKSKFQFLPVYKIYM